MRTKFSPLHLYKSSFQRQVTTLTYKIFLLAYIKATVKAFWWGALLKFPHLIAIENAKIKRGKQKFFSYNSRRDRTVY